MNEFLSKLIRKEDLTQSEAFFVMKEISQGRAGEIQISSFLTALAVKGESSSELEGFANALKEASHSWPSESSFDLLCDTCGTGGDGLGTLNISTLSAILLASLGIPVAKHGNRAMSGKIGSADLLEGLGIILEASPQKVLQSIHKAGISFLFAPVWHPAMKNVASVRQQLGIRTIFNLLGPLLNPAPVTHQLIGVFHRDFLNTVAKTLSSFQRKGGYVVSALDGLDEVSPAASTHFIRIEDGKIVEEGYLEPESFGFSKKPLEELQIKNKSEAIQRSILLLQGKGGSTENQSVVMNSSLLYSMIHRIPLKEAADICMDSLCRGKGWETVELWRRC